MPSMYDGVTKNLPKWQDDTPGYADKIRAMKARIMGGPAEDCQMCSRSRFDHEMKADGVCEQFQPFELPINMGAHIVEQTKLIAAAVKDLTQLLTHASGGKYRASDLARGWRDLRKVKDIMEDAESGLNLRLAAFAELLDAQFEEEDIEGVPLGDGDKITMTKEPHLKVVDRDLFRQWCMENGLERELNLQWQTGNAIVKKMLLKGEPLPPGTECTSKPKFAWR